MTLLTGLPQNPNVNPLKINTQSTPIDRAMGLVYAENSMKVGQMFHMEALTTIASDWATSLNERINLLALAVGDGFLKIGTHLNFTNVDRYDARNISYRDISMMVVPNPMGLQGSMEQLIEVLTDAFIQAKHIFAVELPTAARLVSKLVTEQEILDSQAPHPIAIDLQTTRVNIYDIRERVSRILNNTNNSKMIEFGKLYHSMKQWGDVSDQAMKLSKEAAKLDLKGFARDVTSLTLLLDKLIRIVKSKTFSSANVELYSGLLEETSGNIAFAGGVFQLITQTTIVIEEHRKMVEEVAQEAARLKK